jgi:hypothetical protein
MAAGGARAVASGCLAAGQAGATVAVHADRERSAVPDNLEPLVLDLLEWVGSSPRAYAEALDAWRTSCPGLPVWEDARERGFIERRYGRDRRELISLSTAGRVHLRQHRAAPADH